MRRRFQILVFYYLRYGWLCIRNGGTYRVAIVNWRDIVAHSVAVVTWRKKNALSNGIYAQIMPTLLLGRLQFEV